MNTFNQSLQNHSTLEKENVESVINFFQNFLETFEMIDTVNGQEVVVYPYHEEAKNIVEQKRTTLHINFDHLIRNNNFDLIEIIHEEYFKYERFLRKAVYNFLYRKYPEYARQKIFNLSFFNLHEVDSIRSLKTNKLGKLISFKGTLTKTTEVRPELLIGNFQCDNCGANAGLKEQQFKFTKPKTCKLDNCTNQTKFSLVNQGSIFTDWQKIKVQESNSDLPSGAVPRSIDVILRNEQVEKAQPGDRVMITGTLIVVPDIYSMLKPGEKNELSSVPESRKIKDRLNNEGVKGLRNLGIQDLNYKLVFLANNIVVNQMKFLKENNMNVQHQMSTNNQDEEEEMKNYMNQLSENDKLEIQNMKGDPQVFNKLANLISPSVLGNTEIKKGILLMLFGGVNKKTKDGMKIRGDINICLVGDPSTAKSQFLKFVHNYIPRTVYTSGRGSSSAGLTASLSRDPETGDYTLEAGALMLADNGICCIDEFDKMQEKDTVAIHEAMEQQTISITKAGIQATLNARCSILAAMNPIMGRYDKTKNLRSNVRLSPPLMSRFDIFFVLTDECRVQVDMAIAKRIVRMHKDHMKIQQNQKVQQEDLFNHSSMLRYMRFSRYVKPKITQKAKQMLVRVYLRMRTNEFSLQKTAYRITVRQLESLIRLSESCARIHCSFSVTEEHVREAVKLLNSSIIRIDQGDLNLDIEEKIQEGLEQIQQQAQENEKALKKMTSTTKDTVKLKKSEYKAIQEELIALMHKITENSEDKIVSVENLSLQLLQNQLQSFDSVKDMQHYERISKAIIKKMATKDKIFLLQQDDQGKDLVSFHPTINQ